MKNKFNITHIPSLVIKSFKAWSNDNAFEKSAATAYFALFSLPGLLLITVSVLSLFMDSETTVRELTANLESVLGEKSAKDIAGILAKINMKDQSLLMGIIGVCTLVFGATSLSNDDKNALMINDTKSKKPIITITPSEVARSFITFKNPASSVLSTCHISFNAF